MEQCKFYFKPYYADPDNSVAVFERGRFNEYGQPYCIAPGLTYQQARALIKRLNERMT